MNNDKHLCERQSLGSTPRLRALIHQLQKQAVAVVAVSALAGCGDGGPEQQSKANAVMMEALRSRAEMEVREAAARHQLEIAEQSIRRQQTERDRAQRAELFWRSGSAGLIVIAGFALFAGAAVGSATRKEVQG